MITNKLKLLLCLLIFCLAQTGMAATYYVSNSGNDSNAGTDPSSSWQTLNKVSAATFQPGDQILFNCGDVFYGSMTITQSGTAGNPITFGSYGSGANPVITGFTAVNGWNNLGGNIWESTGAVSALATCNMVTVNGVNTAMGRYPNAGDPNGGYLTFQSGNNTSLTSSALTGTPNWTGAEAVVRTANWLLVRSTITSQSGGTINYAATGAPSSYADGFFIQNDIRTLDQQNEWYYNPATGKLDIYSISQPANVNIASIDNLIIVAAHYFTIQNLTFNGANSCAMFGGTSYWNNITVNNCTFNNIGVSACYERGNNLIFQNNTITNCNSGAITTPYGSNITIRNNTIQNIGVLAGMRTANVTWPNPYSTNQAVACATVSNYTVTNNFIQNTGYIAISFYGSSVLIQNNFIDTFCTVLDDGGGYTRIRAVKARRLIR